MPELPEVETVVRCLRPALVGRRLSAPRVTGKALRRGWQAAWQERLHQQPMVRTVERRGKWILIRLDRGDGLLAHLGMTGRLHVVPADRPLAPHTHLVFPLAPGDQELRYRDTRRFGLVEWMTEGKLEAFLAERLGPDPFSLRGEEFYRALRRTRRGLKTALLDQRVVAGLGNIYADEALFAAQLSPFRKGSGIRVKEAGRLLLAIQRVLRRAIDKKGATIRDFFWNEAEQGEFQNEFRVYQQAGRPCPRCRTPIRRVFLGGRSTHFCPVCQPVAGSRRRRRKAVSVGGA